MIDFIRCLRIGIKGGDLITITRCLYPLRPVIVLNVQHITLGPSEVVRGYAPTKTLLDYFPDEMDQVEPTNRFWPYRWDFGLNLGVQRIKITPYMGA